MADQLPWKEYGGETAEQLVELRGTYRTDSLVCAFETALVSANKDLYSKTEQIILCVEDLEREVNNGGFSQFFANSTPELVLLVVDSLESIKCPNAAKISSEAIALLNLPANFTEEDLDDGLTDEVEEQLGNLDQRFFKYEDDIATRLLEYITAHVGDVKIP